MNEKQLVVLGGNINAAHRQVLAAASGMMEKAYAVGEKLNRAKAEVPRGQWASWMSENLEFSERTAQGYMKIANNWDAVSGEPSLDKAMKMLSLPKPQSSADSKEKPEKNDSGVAGTDGANPAAAGEAAEDEEWEYVDEPADGEAEGTEARTDATVLKKRLVATVGAAIREVDRLHDAEPNFPKAEACRQHLDKVLKVVNSWRVD